MGRLGIVQAFARIVRGSAEGSEVTARVGGGANVAAVSFAAPGDDAVPLLGDYVVLVPGPGAGKDLAVAYADPQNAGQAAAGERRIYSRDPLTGDVAAAVWLKADGSVVVDNGLGQITLGTAGTITLNGVTIDPSGNVTVPGGGSISSPSVVANGNELDGHIHFVAGTPGNTGPNL